MKFDLVRPCGNCPFRTDMHPFLEAARVREILGDPDAKGKRSFPATAFICHKTIDYDDSARGRVVDPNNQHCAGAAIVLIRDEIPNDAMQLAERLLGWKPDRLDMTAAVYQSRRDCIRAHETVDA
jgi:hypothetical protein